MLHPDYSSFIDSPPMMVGGAWSDELSKLIAPTFHPPTEDLIMEGFLMVCVLLLSGSAVFIVTQVIRLDRRTKEAQAERDALRSELETVGHLATDVYRFGGKYKEVLDEVITRALATCPRLSEIVGKDIPANVEQAYELLE
jgi:hypothetical protein